MDMRFAIYLFLSILFYSLEGTPPLPIHEAFVPKSPEPLIPILASKKPPSPITENVPTQPSSDLIWISGYWIWEEGKKDYVWVCGVWRRPPPQKKWISGEWVDNDGGWVRTKGFWSSSPIEKVPLFKSAPPISIEEKMPQAMGDDYFWNSGFWAYSYDKKDYVWLSGKWEQFHNSWVLTPSTYLWRPSGYLFISAYWDWALQDRGFAYSCNAIVDPRLIETKSIVHHLYDYYPDYRNLVWHCWHFHPEWWNGCDCVPTWWFWPEWWTLTWDNMWGCFWWWTHPGTMPPAWITYDLSMAIAPASNTVLDHFIYFGKPPFVVQAGNQPLSPLSMGPYAKKNVPKPLFPTNILPAGTVKAPPLPQNQQVQLITEKNKNLLRKVSKNP